MPRIAALPCIGLLLGALLPGQGFDLERPRLLEAAGEPLVLPGVSGVSPCVGDWNGDGLDDLLLGDCRAGGLRLYRNIGTCTAPKYAAAEWVQVGDEKLRLPTPWC
jgi:hypothetical protein